MILLPNSIILFGLDFNFDFEQTLGCSRLLAGNPHAPRQTRFLADHDASATDNFPALRRRAPRRSQGQGLYLLGSVPRDIEVNLRAQAKRRYHMGASQVQHKVSAAILPTSRSCEHSNRLRSDRRAHCLLHRQRLSASDSSSCCQRREWQTLDLSDQQLCSQSRDDRSTLSATMAGRVVLQVDQAAPSDQDLSGHQRERSQDANLDRGLHVRADRYTQKTIETAQQSSRNSTNPEFDYV